MSRSIPHRTSSGISSSYFQGNSSLEYPGNSATPSGYRSRRPQVSHSEYSGYSPSVTTISRPPTARPPSRPGTSSGRRSRNTGVSSILGQSEAYDVVCAVSESRGVAPSVGIAFVNVSIGEVIITQICDNKSYRKTIHQIQLSSPTRVLFMSTACPPNNPSTLFSLVQNLVSDTQIDAMERSAWSETEGIEHIHNLAFKGDIEPLKVATQGKFYAISSFAAVSASFQQVSWN